MFLVKILIGVAIVVTLVNAALKSLANRDPEYRAKMMRMEEVSRKKRALMDYYSGRQQERFDEIFDAATREWPAGNYRADIQAATNLCIKGIGSVTDMTDEQVLAEYERIFG